MNIFSYFELRHFGGTSVDGEMGVHHLDLLSQNFDLNANSDCFCSF